MVPTKLVCMHAIMSLAELVSTGSWGWPGVAMPALLNRMSTVNPISLTLEASCWIDCSDATSQGIMVEPAEHYFITSVSSGALAGVLQVAITRQPAVIKCLVNPRPSPREQPVITTVLPFKVQTSPSLSELSSLWTTSELKFLVPQFVKNGLTHVYFAK